MNEFKKYQHIERLGSDEVDGIEYGTCVIMPKIDGTNASIWRKEGGVLGFGSRTRELSLEKDNAGFMNAMFNDERFHKFFERYPHVRLYGEWLVPHTLKTYKKDAWKKFYVFDVTIEDEPGGTIHIPFHVYEDWLKEFGIDYIEPLAVVTNPDKLSFYDYLDQNTFLMDNDIGEGIVIKNYGYRNKYGRQTWAKIVRSEFKAAHKSMKEKEAKALIELLESKIVDEYVTQTLVDKEYAKIVNEENGWSSKYIPRLLSTVYHCLICEELWGALKKFKDPKIDFRLLRTLCIDKIKQLKSDLF